MPSGNTEKLETAAKAAPEEHRPADACRPWPYLSLGALLAIAFGALVALSVGAILAMSVRANFVNTISLLNARAISLIDGMERQMASEAGQAERAASALARLHAEGILDRPDGRRPAFIALLEASPAVEGLVLEADGVSASIFRTGEDRYAELPDNASKPDLEHVVANSRKSYKGADGWGVPQVLGGSLFHNVAVGLGESDSEGIAIAFVGQDVVSRVMRQVAPVSDATVFLLTQNGEVISHSGRPDLFEGREIRKIEEFPDPVVRGLPKAEEVRGFGQAAESGIRVFNSTDGRHIVLTKSVAGYSATPFVLGVYFTSAELGGEMLRAINSLLVGLGGLLVSIMAAIFLGRYISRPMRKIAATATQFSDFRMDDLLPLSRSRIREIDNQAQALNRMRIALQQFSRYVPKQLVARLMRTGEHLSDPEEREMTILFTDIMGFTGLAEIMSAPEIATLLNSHFEMLAGKVDSTGGTIDKFMGDSVMAFWGAPERDEDHAYNAARAAQAIASATRAENAVRRKNGEPVLRIRMGIHTGKVVVGDIGSRDRQNYTVIGDTVNIAQRLEQLAKEIIPAQEDAIILASSDVVAATGERARYIPLGEKSIKGREGPISVCILQTDDAGNSVRGEPE